MFSLFIFPPIIFDISFYNDTMASVSPYV